MNSNPDLLDCVYCLPLKLLDSLVSRPLFSPLRLVEVLRGYTPKCLYVSRSFRECLNPLEVPKMIHQSILSETSTPVAIWHTEYAICQMLVESALGILV